MGANEKDIIQRFRRLHIGNNEGEEFRINANSLLDQLFSCAHRMSGPKERQLQHGLQLTEQDLNSFITYGCKILERKSSLLKSKFVDTICLILTKQQRILSEDVLPILLSFLFTSLHESPASLKINFLQALGAAFYRNGPMIDLETLDEFLGPVCLFWSFLDPSKDDFTTQIECIQCIGNLCLKSIAGLSIEKSYLRVFYQHIMDYLRGLLNLEDREDLELYKLVGKTLKTLQKIISLVVYQNGIIEPEFAIALLRVYLVYGLPAFHSIVAHLVKNLPSGRVAPTFDTGILTKKAKSPLAKQVVKKKRKGKKQNNKKQNFQDEERSKESSVEIQSNLMTDDNILHIDAVGYFVSSQSSSESEFSDPESGFRSRLRTSGSRVRQHASKCIQDILKTSDRRAKLSSWLLLIPETVSQLEPSLMSCFLNDPSSKVRLSGLSTLMELINDSKQYLDAAVDRSQSQQSAARSFVPFSVKLNQSLVLLHEAFLEHLGGRRSDFATEKALQCLSILVLNTPYEKIGSENLYKVVELMPKYLYAADLNVTISSLTCLAASLSVKPNDIAIQSLMTTVPQIIQCAWSNTCNSNVGFKSWLVKYCYNELENDESGASSDSAVQERIQNQCLQVLKIVVQFYPILISSSERKSLLNFICVRYIRMAECMLSFHSIKLLEEFGKSFLKIRDESTNHREEELAFWKDVLEGPLMKLFQSETPVAKILSAACDVLATISEDCFEVLPPRCQIMVKTLLLGAANDDENQIKSAAIRALGILVTYHFVKEDSSFVVDVGEVIFRQIQSPSLNVRIKAGWSLGNFTDSLLTNSSTDGSDSNMEFPEIFIKDLLESCKKSALDHDKVKPNGVRAIGNVLKWLPPEYVEQPDIKMLVEGVIAALVQNIISGPMKGRWNACYACGNMFQGSSLDFGGATWMKDILNALGSAMKDCKNFKVRISAAIALGTPKHRSNYGDEIQFSSTWVNAIDALISSENLSDFTEFKFKNNLQNKICRLVCHLLSLTSPHDLAITQPSIDANLELINEHLGRFLDEISKEKQTSEVIEGHTVTSHEDVDVNGLMENLSKLERTSSNFGSLRKIMTKLSFG